MSKTKSKKKARLSVTEFQTWLEGIMEFQSDEWAPNTDQWNAIFERIMDLKTEGTVVNITPATVKELSSTLEEVVDEAIANAMNYVDHQPSRPQQTQQRQPTQNTYPDDNAPRLFDEPAEPLLAGPNESLEDLSQEEIERRIANGETISSGSNGMVKTITTPNVDSTNGYKTGFA